MNQALHFCAQRFWQDSRCWWTARMAITSLTCCHHGLHSCCWTTLWVRRLKEIVMLTQNGFIPIFHGIFCSVVPSMFSFFHFILSKHFQPPSAPNFCRWLHVWLIHWNVVFGSHSWCVTTHSLFHNLFASKYWDVCYVRYNSVLRD